MFSRPDGILDAACPVQRVRAANRESEGIGVGNRVAARRTRTAFPSYRRADRGLGTAPYVGRSSALLRHDRPISASARVGRYYDPTTGQFLTIDPLVEQPNARYACSADDAVNRSTRCVSLQCDPDPLLNSNRPGGPDLDRGPTRIRDLYARPVFQLPRRTRRPYSIPVTRSSSSSSGDLFGGESITGGFDPFPGSPGYTRRPDGLRAPRLPITDSYPVGIDRAGPLRRIVERVERGGTLAEVISGRLRRSSRRSY